MGALGAVTVPDWNTTVAISQWVFAPVRAVAFGVAPAAGSSCSSTSRSIVLLGDTLVRTVYPVPPTRAVPKPEST